MTDKQKIIEYLKKKDISKNKFYVKTGLSVGFLDKGSSLGVDKLRIIIDNYPDLNHSWLLTGEGEMLIDSDANGVDLNNREESVDTNTQLNGVLFTPFYHKYVETTRQSFAKMIQDLPKTTWKLPKEYENISIDNFLSFEMVGDSMSDGSYKSLINGDILLGLEIDRADWNENLNTEHYKYVVMYNDVRIYFANIEVDINRISLSFLNSTSKTVEMRHDHVFKLYQIIKISRDSQF